MKKVISVALFSRILALSGCASTGYSGSGGMTKRSIKGNAYQHHYKNGFTGADAMGWDPNLQYAWSRSGAALTCGVKFNKDLVISQLIKKYGKDKLVHDLNGITFHHLQSKGIKDFCSPDVLSELKVDILNFEKGVFPKKF